MTEQHRRDTFAAGYAAALARTGDEPAEPAEVAAAYDRWSAARTAALLAPAQPPASTTIRLTAPRRAALAMLAAADGPVEAGPMSHTWTDVEGKRRRLVAGYAARALVRSGLARRAGGAVPAYVITDAGRAALTPGR